MWKTFNKGCINLLSRKKYVICYSGGHQSALAAVEVSKKVPKEDIILLNHNISSKVEHEDIKRFKREVSEYLGIPITYANAENFEERTPLKIAKELGGFKFGKGTALCTYVLKTEPFQRWLKNNFPVSKEKNKIIPRDDVVIIYGFSSKEKARIQRRVGIMSNMGYKTDYPLAFWDRTISQIEDIGIKRPITYKTHTHGNCQCCLKSAKTSFYVTYCENYELWKEAVETEKEIGYSILKNVFLEDLEPTFKKMKCRGIVPSEYVNYNKFWVDVKKMLPEDGQMSFLPCECSI